MRVPCTCGMAGWPRVLSPLGPACLPACLPQARLLAGQHGPSRRPRGAGPHGHTGKVPQLRDGEGSSRLHLAWARLNSLPGWASAAPLLHAAPGFPASLTLAAVPFLQWGAAFQLAGDAEQRAKTWEYLEWREKQVRGGSQQAPLVAANLSRSEGTRRCPHLPVCKGSSSHTHSLPTALHPSDSFQTRSTTGGSWWRCLLRAARPPL